MISNLSIANTLENEILIKLKINENIITNFDIIKESNYLKALNLNFKNFDEKQLLNFAETSLIREVIKKNEIEKYYEIDYDSESVDVYIDKFIKDLNLKDIEELKIYISEFGISIQEIRTKLIVEQIWNKMIFEIYKDRVEIDEKRIEKILEDAIENNENQKMLKLSEIVFMENQKQELQKKYEEIILSIETNGFKDTALIHSIADSRKAGGEIGWLNINQLSEKIKLELVNLNINDLTKPISIGGGNLILKIDDIKKISIDDIDKEAELSKIRLSEKNRKLNEFSIIHYRKIEKKTYVKKF